MTTKIKTAAKSPEPTLKQLALISTLAADGLDAAQIASALNALAGGDAKQKGRPAPLRFSREQIQKAMADSERQRHARLNAQAFLALRSAGINAIRSADGKIRYGCEDDEEPRPLGRRKLVGRAEHNAPKKIIA